MKFEWQDLTLGDVVETVIDYRGKTPKKLGGDWSNTGYRAFLQKTLRQDRLFSMNQFALLMKKCTTNG